MKRNPLYKQTDKNRNTTTKYVSSPRQRHAHEKQIREMRNTNYTKLARCAAYYD